MRHEADIVAVVLCNVFLRVAEHLTLGEQLLEAAKAAGHGSTSSIDDLRIRQNQLDQTDVSEVIGHFIDEEGRPLPMHSGVVDVLLTHGPKLIRG